jgi:predicted ABC-type sugar transport system permease subunit
MNSTVPANGSAGPAHSIQPAHSPGRLLAAALSGFWASTRLFRPVLVLLIALVLALSFYENGFFTRLNLQNVATSVSILWLIALGATFV